MGVGPVAAAYRAAAKIALVIQLVVMVVLSTILDGGEMARVGLFAAAGFWVGTGVIVLRRPQSPRLTDLLYVRWGYVPLCIVAVAIAAMFAGLRP